MTQQAVYPIEVELPSGITLRGVERAADGPPVLFVHDLGEDLDVWGPIPAEVAAHGFRVISLDLRGHGLSDGETDAASTLGDLTAALGVIGESFGPAGLVAHGSVAEAALALGAEHGTPVHIVISPAPLPDGGIDLENPVPAMRALFVGANDDTAYGYVRSVYPRLRGQNMWFSTGTSDQGVTLLMNHPHLVEQLSMFLRRYLMAYHLAWIAQHQAPTGGSGDDPGMQTAG